MIKREIEENIKRLAKEFKIVTVLGPRQSGKTTLVKQVFKNYNYANLEDVDTFRLASSDIKGFFNAFKKPLIIDEIQRFPPLLNQIQVMVDDDETYGQFILTGSFSIALKDSISQSLVGRTSITNLLPLSINELKNSGQEIDRDSLLFRGFMPALYKNNIDIRNYYASYFQTYVERDVLSVLKIKDRILFENFLMLLAGRVGNVLNFESLSNDCGVSRKTIMEWLSVLESSFIIFRLPAYFKNLNKRITKAPKIYFYEPGLLSFLLGIHNKDEVAKNPTIGALFENMVILEAMKFFHNRTEWQNLYYFRDNNSLEVDLIIPRGEELLPIEIKSSFTFNPEFEKNLNKFIKLSNSPKGFVIYSGDLEKTESKVDHYNFANVDKLLSPLISS